MSRRWVTLHLLPEGRKEKPWSILTLPGMTNTTLHNNMNPYTVQCLQKCIRECCQCNGYRNIFLVHITVIITAQHGVISISVSHHCTHSYILKVSFHVIGCFHMTLFDARNHHNHTGGLTVSRTQE